MGERMLWESTQDRERDALARWLAMPPQTEELLGVLGISGPAWFGIGLSRAKVFGSRQQGDVDLLVGGAQALLRPAEMAARVEVERLRRPGWPIETITGLAFLKACAEGCFAWPTAAERLVGCEVKASWFDSESGAWKASHRKESQRISGQLRLLVKQGLDAVCFLHLGATRPFNRPGESPYVGAAFVAGDACAAFEPVELDADLGECGSLAAVTGAVGQHLEHSAGAGGHLRVLRPPVTLQERSTPWKRDFLSRLSELPPFRTLLAFVGECLKCGAWVYSDSPLEFSHSCRNM